MQKDFVIADILEFAWRITKANFIFFVGLIITAAIVTSVPTNIAVFLKDNGSSNLVVLPVFLLAQAAGIIVTIGFIKIALSLTAQFKPRFLTLFDARKCFCRYIITAIIYAIIIHIGLVLFIVPGIVWAVKYQFCFRFLIDKGLSPINALRASSRATKGVKLKLLGFDIIYATILLLGAICLGVGLFAAYPVVLIATTRLYRDLIDQTPELAELGIVISTPNTNS